MPLPGEQGEGGSPPGARAGRGIVTDVLARLAACEPTAAPHLAPGTRVGRYEVIRAIGHGGFGSVYEAHDRSLNRLVALKVLDRARPAAGADAGEGEAAARLAHPNIAALHDVGVVEGAPYLVYELLHGETLESRLARGPLPAREALGVAAQVARALGHAHAAGVVHRDLKPANVFLTAEGEAKVLDFGVALVFGRPGAAGGTPAYMAPEQRRGEAEDARTDLHALGLLLAEMLGGERPGGAPPSRERVPAPVRPVLATLLAEDPGARPRSAGAALAQLEAAARALGERGPRARGRVLAIALAGAVAVAVAAIAGMLVVRERGAPPPPAPNAAAGEVPSIAVLPFADLSPQGDQAYFSDGLAEEILNALAQLEGLRVVGRTSSFSFKGKDVDAATIAAKLNVSTLLEGSVRKAGNRVRINAQLVGAADGYRIWSQTFDRELTDVFAVQDEIARAVVAALRPKLASGAQPSTRGYRTASPEVYDLYLRGRQLGRRISPEGWKEAMATLERALDLDPGYAPAWAELARATFWYGNSLPRAPTTTHTSARRCARRTGPSRSVPSSRMRTPRAGSSARRPRSATRRPRTSRARSRSSPGTRTPTSRTRRGCSFPSAGTTRRSPCCAARSTSTRCCPTRGSSSARATPSAGSSPRRARRSRARRSSRRGRSIPGTRSS